MEALKGKIFQVLIESISIIEFENWLYGCKEILNEIDRNPFYFDVVSLNYKNEGWDMELNQLVLSNFDSDYLEILKIKKACLNIISSQDFEEISSILKGLLINFDYETEYSILWKFCQLNDYFGLVDDGIWKVGTLKEEAKFYAKQTIELLKKYNHFEPLHVALEESLKKYKKECVSNEFISKPNIESGSKLTLKQKIFAFFKKS